MVLALFFSSITLAAPSQMRSIANQFSAKIIKLEKTRVAVLPFRYEDGRESSGSAMLSEQVGTDLALKRELKLADRKIVRKKLFSSTVVDSPVPDAETIRKMGELLEVDVLVTGTLQDFAKNQTLVTARLFRTDTGEEIAISKSIVKRTWTDEPKFPESAVP